jgi:hypothetical protein
MVLPEHIPQCRSITRRFVVDASINAVISSSFFLFHTTIASGVMLFCHVIHRSDYGILRARCTIALGCEFGMDLVDVGEMVDDLDVTQYMKSRRKA